MGVNLSILRGLLDSLGLLVVRVDLLDLLGVDEVLRDPLGCLGRGSTLPGRDLFVNTYKHRD